MDEENPAAISLLLSEEDLPKLYSFYGESKEGSANPNLLFLARGEGFSLSVYAKSHGGSHKVLFQGKEAKKEAKRWEGLSQKPALFTLPPKLTVIRRGEESENHYPQIGSDEVGTGDSFGPIVVVASLVEKGDLPFLQELGVTDSKKMSDDHILEIGPSLVKKFRYSALVLDNLTYNAIYSKKENMNSMKAKMHNRCLLNVLRKCDGISPSLYQDQFAAPDLYYSYLKKEKEVARGIVFKTKGELSFPSVALSSVLARYGFLKKMEEMSEEYSFDFPKGSVEVEASIEDFVRRFGEKELGKVAKLNFKTFERFKKA